MIGDERPETPSSDTAFEKASRNTLALNPLIGVRGKDLLDGAAVLVRAMVNEPKVAADEWGAFFRELTDIAQGESERTPAGGDKRFAGPPWKGEPLHSGLRK